MRNIKLIIEYDGTSYCGWQVQANGVAIQQVVQDAIRKMTQEDVVLIGASRTDAGVHALGQVANFRTGSGIPCGGFVAGLNSMLPADIVVRSAEEVPLEFHAQKDAKTKHYRYIILYGGVRPALWRGRAWFLPLDTKIQDGLIKYTQNQSITLVNSRFQPDPKRMREVAGGLVGEHDFSAFAAAGDENESKVRSIDKIEVRSEEIPPLPPLLKGGWGGFTITIDIAGNGFLRHMVRNIVGTLVEVGSYSSSESRAEVRDESRSNVGSRPFDKAQGRPRSNNKMQLILSSRDRKKAGICAPACGLYLMGADY